MLTQHLNELRQQFCADLSDDTSSCLFNNPNRIAQLLLALVESPRPLCLWKLIEQGVPAYGLSKNDLSYALFACQALRLVRLRGKGFYLALTPRGAALTGEVISHFHRVH